MLASSALVLGSFASAAVAVNTARALVFPDTVSLAERQAEGGRYECHANCGYALQGSSEEGYCDDEEWQGLFQGCLECALEYDIWRHYGGGLTPAAEACGLDATPVPVDGGDDETTTTAAEETTTAAETSAAEETSAAQETTTAAEETTAADATSAAEETTVADETSVAEETSAAEETTVADATSAAESTAEPTAEPTTGVASTPVVTIPETFITTTPEGTPTSTPTAVPTGAASKNWGSAFVAGAAVFVALNMI